MKIRTKKIALFAAAVMMCASLCLTCLTAAFAAGSYLFNGNPSEVTGYNGKTAAVLASDESKPEDSLTGGSFVYSNTAGAGATYSWVGSASFDANETYDAARFVVYVDDPMLSWTLQFGVFASADAIADGACKFDNLMDSSGIRWEKASGRESGLTAGWNVITLPFNDVEMYDGFNRNNYMLDSKGAVDGFAVRAHSGSTPFTLKIYSVEMVKLSDTVRPGVKKYGEKLFYEYDSHALKLLTYTSGTGQPAEAEMEIAEGETATAYQASGWGGYLAVYSVEPVDASELANSGYGALSFRIWFQDEASLNVYKLAPSFNLDICCSAEYSDSYKYSFNVAAAFEKCSVGWNQIVVPLSKADEKNNMDWSTVRNLRINATGVGGTPSWTATAKYELIPSEVTELTVVGWVDPGEDPDTPKENLRIECEHTGLHLEGCDEAWADSQAESGEGFYKQGTGAIKFVGQGTAGSGKVLADSFDLSAYESLSFWLYTDNAASFLAMADGQLEMTSSGGADDANEYHWLLKELSLKDGWNYVTLRFDAAEVSGNADIKAINYLRVYFVGLPQACTVIFDDFHAHRAASGTVIESFDNGFSTFVEVVGGKVGGATNMSGEGYVARVKKAEPIDIADYDLITLWVYCENETAAKSVAGSEMELSSSGTCDQKELTFHFPDTLQVGWNYLKFNIADAVHTGGDPDLTKINFVGFVKQGIPQVTVYFDDLRAIESSTLAEAAAPIEREVILGCDRLTAGVFDGMTIDDVEYKQGFSSLTTNGQNASEVLSATFGPIRTGLELSGANELGYGFWFYIDSVSKLSSLTVELSSSSAADAFELEWTVEPASLVSGWNWLTFRASEASRTGGVIDLNAICRTRLIVFGSEALTVKLDAFVLADATVAGALDPVEDKVELNPIDRVAASDCETEWVGGTLNELEKKQGYASVELSKEQNATDAVSASTSISVGKTDLLINNVKSNNELGVTLWLYVEDASAVNGVTLRLTDSNLSANNLAWTIAGLADGWNWVTLAVTDAVVTGVVDPDALSELELTVTAASDGEGQYQAFKVLVDRVSIVNYKVAASLEEPADESLSRNPVQELIFIDCNTTGGTVFSGNRVDKEDYCYGTGSVYTSGYGYALTATDLEIGKTDLTKNTLVLAFWIWIEDVAYYDAAGVDAEVELASSNAFDRNEINWNFMDCVKNFQNGWNWVVLYGKDGTITGGDPNYDGLCRFRLYVNGIADSTMKIDRITLGHIGNTKLAEEPDVEAEKNPSDGGFKGANAYSSENSPYMEIDFDEAEGFVVRETITEGCGAASAASLGLIGLLLAAAAVFRFRR